MADTIITNSPDRGTVAQDNGAVGLVVAILVVLALIVLGLFFFRHGAPGVPNTGSTNVNVSLPSGGGTDGGTSAGSSAGSGLTGSVSGSGAASGATQ